MSEKAAAIAQDVLKTLEAIEQRGNEWTVDFGGPLKAGCTVDGDETWEAVGIQVITIQEIFLHPEWKAKLKKEAAV